MSLTKTSAHGIDILDQVVATLRAVTAERDAAFSGGIRRETRIVHDLDCDSTDIVALCLQLEVCFKRRDLSLDRLFMKNGSYRDDVSVGEIADFLGQQMGKDAL